MAVRKFFVNNGQINVGPFEMGTIIDKVEKCELRATDKICVNSDADEWILICQHPEFLQHFDSKKPSLRTETASGVSSERSISVIRGKKSLDKTLDHEISAYPTYQDSIGQDSLGQDSVGSVTAISKMPLPESSKSISGGPTAGEWYVLKGKNRFGPFLYLDVVRMLQDKSVFEYDFVWCQGLEGWKRIAEVSFFSPDQIRLLYGQDDKEVKLFHRRNFPRCKYETPIIVHDNNNIWKGKTIELGEGGAGVLIQNAMILPGQNVYIHFKPGPLSKSFNVLSEIVCKKFIKGIRDNEAPVIYGIKFINIQKQDREAIRMLHTAA